MIFLSRNKKINWAMLAVTTTMGLLGNLYAQESVLVFQQDSVYVGRFAYTDQPISHTFSFEVAGDSSLTIEDVVNDCACVTVHYPKRALQPKEKGEIRVAYFPYKPGPFEKIFTLKTNGSPKEQQVYLTGYIEISQPAPMLEFPHVVGNLWFKTRHIAFGGITDQGPVRRSVQFYNPTDRVITLKDSTVTPKHIEIILDKAHRVVLPQERGSFDLYYHPETKADYGYQADNIVLFTDDSLTRRLDLTVTAIITQYFPPVEEIDFDAVPQLVVDTDLKDIGRVTLSRYSVELVDFVLKNDGSVPLKIYRANPQEGCMVVSKDFSEIPPSGQAQFRVQVKDIGKSGVQERTVLLYTNDPLLPVKSLRIKLDVRRN